MSCGVVGLARVCVRSPSDGVRPPGTMSDYARSTRVSIRLRLLRRNIMNRQSMMCRISSNVMGFGSLFKSETKLFGMINVIGLVEKKRGNELLSSLLLVSRKIENNRQLSTGIL